MHQLQKTRATQIDQTAHRKKSSQGAFNDVSHRKAGSEAPVPQRKPASKRGRLAVSRKPSCDLKSSQHHGNLKTLVVGVGRFTGQARTNFLGGSGRNWQTHTGNMQLKAASPPPKQQMFNLQALQPCGSVPLGKRGAAAMDRSLIKCTGKKH